MSQNKNAQKSRTKTVAKPKTQKETVKTSVLMSQQETSAPQNPVPNVLIGIILLGVFCVLLGFGSIIAANWDMIPHYVKTGGGLLLLCVSLNAAFYFESHQNKTCKEVALFAAFWLIGGNIALIQQVYHLSISFTQGSLIWAICATPLLFFTKLTVMPILCTLLYVIGLLHILKQFRALLDWMLENYSLVAAVFFLLYLIGHIIRNHLRFANFLRTVGLVGMFGVLLIGDTADVQIVGFTLNILFLSMLSSANNQHDQPRFFNLLMIFVALRCVLAFWTAYSNLLSTGVALMLFGTAILAVATVIYYQKERFCALFEIGSLDDLIKSVQEKGKNNENN